MKKILPYLLIVVAFIVGFYLNQRISQKKIDSERRAKEEAQQQYQQLKQLKVEKQKEAVELTLKKEKALENVTTGAAYFTAEKKNLTPGNYQIDIYFNAGDKAAADAADLTLDIPDDLKVTQVIPGKAFASYPRQLIGQKTVIITGVTVIQQDKIQFGQPNQLYTSLIIEKPATSSTVSEITLNKNNSKIFFQGESIMDYQRSFTNITLP